MQLKRQAAALYQITNLEFFSLFKCVLFCEQQQTMTTKKIKFNKECNSRECKRDNIDAYVLNGDHESAFSDKIFEIWLNGSFMQS